MISVVAPLELILPVRPVSSAIPDEAAAIAAAVARFEAETASAAVADEEAVSPWQRAALAEGAGAKGMLQEHREGGGSKWLL